MTEPGIAEGLRLRDDAEEKLSEAFQIFVREAESGDPEAVYQLARMFDAGYGCTQNWKAAM